MVTILGGVGGGRVVGSYHMYVKLEKVEEQSVSRSFSSNNFRASRPSLSTYVANLLVSKLSVVLQNVVVLSAGGDGNLLCDGLNSRTRGCQFICLRPIRSAVGQWV